jgi:hypothetical protein
LTTDLAPYISAIPLPQTGQYTITKTATGITPGYDSSTIWATAGTTAPKLDLNFARDKQLVNAVNGSNPITFTRNSIGTYVGSDGLIKTAAANEPRFDHNPVTKESLGLLVEEGRTNLLSGSEDIGPSYWSALNSVSTSLNTIASLDGNNTADKFIENTNTTHKVLARSFTSLANATYTYSLFVKSAERNALMIHVRKSDYSDRFGATFNLSNQVITSETAGLGVLNSTDIKKYPNDWYRISITGNIGSNTSAVVTMYLVGSGGAFDIGYTGNGTSGIYLWGSQLEQGAFATSYIPTTTAAATRATDAASITGTNFNSLYNASQGTFFTKGSVNSLGNTYPGLVYVDDGTVNNSLGFYIDDIGSKKIAAEAYVSGVAQYSVFLTPGAVVPRQIYNMTQTYQTGAGNIRTALNGTLLNPTTATTIPTVNRLLIGALRGNITLLNGPIARITYWDTTLSNTALQGITK